MLMYSARKNIAKLMLLYLGVVAGDELLLRFREVERRAVGLGDAGGHEDQEAERLQEQEPARDEPEPRRPTARSPVSVSDSELPIEQHAREREAVRQLVADHLRRRSQAAEQRVHLLFELQPASTMP